MFDVGDEVICIDDKPVPGSNADILGGLPHISKGRKYLVTEIMAKGSKIDWWTTDEDFCRLSGVPCEWRCSRFRKVRPGRIEEGLATLTGLFEPGQKTRELEDA